jgi:hypothetical protein
VPHRADGFEHSLRHRVVGSLHGVLELVDRCDGIAAIGCEHGRLSMSRGVFRRNPKKMLDGLLGRLVFVQRQFEHGAHVQERRPIGLLGQELLDVLQGGMGLIGLDELGDFLDVARQVGAAELQFFSTAARAGGVWIDGHGVAFSAEGQVFGESVSYQVRGRFM